MRILLLLCLALPALGSSVQQRIVVGSETTINQYPHQLSLRAFGTHSCGASLIGSSRAVTAAHCTGSSIGTYTIVGGTTDRTVENCPNCISRDLNFLSRHSQFDESAPGYPNDIAVLGFISVNFNVDLQAIALATPSDGLFAGDTCTITGWGKLLATDPDPVTLHEAETTVLTNVACVSYWGALSINDGHVCVYNSITSACSGDFGGPLECNNKLVGASSWGDESCSPNFPSVYTRISFFQSWIILQ